jgi:hypothetical protein
VSEGRGLGERLAERIAGPPPAPPVDDPVAWIERRFGVRLWSAQREVVESVHAHRHTAVRAAHSTGKSKVAGLLAAYWIAAHPVGSAFVFFTAPRTAQIRAILWRELGRAHRIGKLPGRLLSSGDLEWWIGDELVGTGRKPAELADPEEAATALQGIHAEHLLCVLDESAGLAPWVWDAVDSLASNEGSRVVALGNPTVRESRFFEVCQPGSGWHSIKIAAADSPNLTGESVPAALRRNLVSREWVQERARRWGTSSGMYAARVLAEFPDADEEGLIEGRWVEAAANRELPPAGVPILGVDVARSGSDETVIYENIGGRIRLLHRALGADTMATTGHVARLLREAEDAQVDRELGRPIAHVDVIGIGAGVFDRLREQGFAVRPFGAAERPQRPERFVNRRAEAYWALREELREGRLDIDPADEDLASQLVAIRWRVNSQGRIQIESKDEMRARGVSSPDRADAVAMALGSVAVAIPAVFERPPRTAAELREADSWNRFLEEPRGHPAYGDSMTGDLWGRET